MDKMLKPTLNFAAGRLCLVLTAFLAVTGCCRDNDTELNDETPSITTIGGTWNVKAISVSNELTYIETPPENAHHPNISITIPDTIQGDISGHTFRNTISFGFEIKENRQIDLKNYGGTRMTEDSLGRAFGNHIMFNVVKFNVVPHCEKPDPQMAHLVFADTQANPKNQKSHFFPPHDCQIQNLFLPLTKFGQV